MRKRSLTVATFVAAIMLSAPAFAGGHHGGGNSPFQGTSGFLGSGSASAGLSSIGGDAKSSGHPSFAKMLGNGNSTNYSSANLGNMKVETNSVTTSTSTGFVYTNGSNSHATTNAGSAGNGSALGQFSWGDCGCGNN